jgi:hypothetical protein
VAADAGCANTEAAIAAVTANAAPFSDTRPQREVPGTVASFLRFRYRGLLRQDHKW